jgi:hypothetical protein
MAYKLKITSTEGYSDKDYSEDFAKFGLRVGSEIIADKFASNAFCYQKEPGGSVLFIYYHNVEILDRNASKHKEHRLKTWPEYFGSVLDGSKRFEVRKDDRNFAPGDVLILEEYDPDREEYTGREVSRRITYKLPGGKFGIDSAFCVLSLVPDN